MDNPVNIYNTSSLPKIGFSYSTETYDKIYSYNASVDIDKLRRKHMNPGAVKFENKKFIIKKSEICEGDGVFADENIPEGTVIDIKNIAHDKINDLAYNQTKEYNFDDVKKHTNCMFLYDFNTKLQKNYGLVILKNIYKGEELSRTYGIEYWHSYNFWSKYKNNKYLLTKNDEDLPPEYIFIDLVTSHMYSSKVFELYGKKCDDKYYYLYTYVSSGTRYIVDITKKNFRKLNLSDCVNNDDIELLTPEQIYNDQENRTSGNLYRHSYLSQHKYPNFEYIKESDLE